MAPIACARRDAAAAVAVAVAAAVAIALAPARGSPPIALYVTVKDLLNGKNTKVKDKQTLLTWKKTTLPAVAMTLADGTSLLSLTALHGHGRQTTPMPLRVRRRRKFGLIQL